MMRLFLYGLSTGLVLQLAVGPVFFFVVGIAMQQSVFHGLAAVAGVTVADYFYIALSLFGVGRLLERPRVKNIMRVLSACIIIFFGLLMIYAALRTVQGGASPTDRTGRIFACFIAAMMLTLSSPLTILFWTGLFSAKAMEHDYNRRQLLVFGYSAGLSTVLFLGTAVIAVSLIKQGLPTGMLHLLNLPVGVILIINGILRLVNGRTKRAVHL